MVTSSKASDSGSFIADGPRGEAAYTSMRQAILSCAIAPGSTLTESAVMETYAIGKSTCRHALVRLIQDGFVKSLPRQGYVVTPVTLKDVEEVFAMRLLLEPAAARLASGRADVRALAQIDKAGRKNTASRNQGNRLGFFLDANREFHMLVANASGNARLAQGISVLLDEMKRFVALGFVEQGASPEIAHDHEELIEALGQNDATRAEQVTVRHIGTFRQMTLDKVMQSIRASNESLPLGNLRRHAS